MMMRNNTYKEAHIGARLENEFSLDFLTTLFCTIKPPNIRKGNC